MKKTSLSELKLALLELKLPKNHVYIIHNSLLKFGVIEGGAAGVIRVIYDVFGADATILMPTFTFAFGENRYWSYLDTKAETGALSEYFRKLPGTERSIHPFHSIAVAGKYSKNFTECKNISSFGKGSPFDVLYEMEAINIALGTEFIGGATFLHHTEEMMQVPYRYYKEFPGTVIDKNGVKLDKTYTMFARIITEQYEYDNDWDLVWGDLVKENLVVRNQLNGANLFSFRIRPTHDSFAKRIAANPFYCAVKILKSEP